MRFCRLFAILLLPALLSPQSGREKRVAPIDAGQRQSFERQPKIAILVGISAYPEGSGLSPLKYAAADVDDLAAELTRQGYAVRRLTDSQATRGVVTRTLNQVDDLLDPDQGTLLFYFSGHGFAQNGVNYLATFGVSVDDLQRDGLPLPEVEQLMKRSKAKRQVLWVDACRSDTQNGARAAGTARSFSKLDAAEGLRVLYSTRAGSVSYEDDTLRHGVFTYFLLTGLRGEAAGADGLLTFQDLAGYVSDSVLSYGVEKGRPQRPFEGGEASGDFLLAKATAPVVPANRGSVLLARAREAMGGTERLGAVRDLRLVSTFQLDPAANTQRVSQTRWWMAPGQMREEDVTPIGKVTTYWDGKAGWISTPNDLRPLPDGRVDEEAAFEIFRMPMTLMLSDRLQGRTVSTEGTDRTKISDREGHSVIVSFDPATGLPSFEAYTYPGDKGAVGEDYFDWRETGGIRLPRRAVMYRGERRYAEITIDDVGVNEGMTQERLSRKP